jgi:hypothetical protein
LQTVEEISVVVGLGEGSGGDSDGEEARNGELHVGVEV